MQQFNVTFDEALEILSSRQSNKFVSNSEKEFVDELEKNLGFEFKYSYKTRQFCKWSEEYHQPFFYDVADTDLKIVIEFFGDYWHCRPKTHSSTFIHPHAKIEARKIWKYDISKRKLIKSFGFTHMIVWESDWKNNRQDVIERIQGVLK